MKRSEAIKNLLNARTHADLAAMYNASMEVQVNVAQDGGERVDNEYQGKRYQSYSDGINTWKHFRIPLNAKTDPEDNDCEITYDLATHVEGIGMTGWNWRDKISRWVAFDFDAMIGHSDRHAKKLTNEELEEVRSKVNDIPWVTVRRSTSGKGLHLYVHLLGVATQDHTEHAALARAILGMLASLTGYDFHSKVDAQGGNMWVWHRKMTGTNGLTIIKQGVPLEAIPPNWRDHISVVSGTTKKVVPAFIQQELADDVEALFNELTGQKTRIALDEEHQRLIKYLHEVGACSSWDQDNHMLVTHTIWLKEAHEALHLRGIFKTNSTGKDRGTDLNAYMFPLRRGAWIVRRFTPGVAEDPTWTQDGQGWTKCTFNHEPDLQTAARSYGGIEHKSGGYVFREAEVALKSLEQLGVNVSLPNWIMTRRCKIKEHRDGRILVEVAHDPNDRADAMEGWLAERGNWTRIFNQKQMGIVEPEIGNYDDMVRHLITETNEDYGWMIKRLGGWGDEPLVHVRTFLKSLSLKVPEVEQVLGSCIAKPWKLVCRPFQDEYLNDRQWNRNAPQLRYSPTKTDELSYPNWLRVLNHCGRGLDDAIKQNTWARSSGILTGADYLKCWIASIFQEPTQPLPYLFFYSSEQNTGKSIFHEALKLLMTCGCVRADTALISQSGFNGELENAVLAIVEETDMRKNKMAYNRIKDWVTSPHLPIHVKMRTPYSVVNTLHFVQTANDTQACPILAGDSRIVMITVEPIPEAELIPKKRLMPLLEKEAPDFLAAVMRLEIPTSPDRLNIPVIETGDKRSVQESNKSYLETFIDECCYYYPGKMVLFGEFYDKFIDWIDPEQVRNWGKMRVGKEVPSRFPKGRSHATHQVMIGNISWTPPPEGEVQEKKVILNGIYLEVVSSGPPTIPITSGGA